MTAILVWLPEYGLSALFGTLVIVALGVPLPGTLLLVAVGSLVSQGQLPLWPVLVLGTLGAVVGDQIGYILGRVGGERAVEALARRGRGDQLRRAHEIAVRWGALGIFLTRWLVGPLGPWVNVTSGIASYSWPRFLVWDVLGEGVWVVLYVMAGKVFSDEVQTVADLSENLAWTFVGLLLAAYFGWRAVHAVRQARVRGQQEQVRRDASP